MGRVVCLVHGDGDGVVSGALAYAYYFMRGHEHVVYFTHPAGLAEDLRAFARPGDTVFIADVALSERDLGEIEMLFRLYADRGELIYIDHHPEPLGLRPGELQGTIIHDTCCSASELVYRYLGGDLGYEYTRVALYGAIGDYLDETPWVRKVIEEWDKRTIYFEAGVLTQGLEGSRRMHEFKREVVKHLAENRLPSALSPLLVRALIEAVNTEEMRKWVKKNISTKQHIAYVVNPPGSLGKAASYARIYGEKPVGLAAAHHHRNVMNMSLRCGRNKIDLNRILREIAPRLGGTGGGHPFAAGARIPVHRFNEFLDMLDREIGRWLGEK